MATKLEDFPLWSGSETMTVYDVNFTLFVLNSPIIDRPSLTSLLLEINSENRQNLFN